MHTFQLETVTLASIIREKVLGIMPTDLAPCKSPGQWQDPISTPVQREYAGVQGGGEEKA